MDNHYLSNTNNLPKWYLDISEYSREIDTYNNYFNNQNFKLCKVLNPDFGFYSILKASDIFKIHPELLLIDSLLIAEYDSNKLKIYNKYKDDIKLIKTFDIISTYNDLNLINLVYEVLSNKSNMVLSEKFITGLFRLMYKNKLKYPFLQTLLSNINPKKVLRNYKEYGNYDFLYDILTKLIKKNYSKSLKENIKFQKDYDKDKVKKFTKKASLSNPSKNEFIFHLIILSVLLGRYGKQTNIIPIPLPIELILDTYIKKAIQFQDQFYLFVDLLKKENIIRINKHKRFYLSIDYEAQILRLFSKYWFDISKKPVSNIEVYDDVKNVTSKIYDTFSSISKMIESKIPAVKKKKKPKSMVLIQGHSGCDNIYANSDTNLLFIKSLSWIYCSSFYKIANHIHKNVTEFYKNISVNNGIKVELIKEEEEKYALKINDSHTFLAPIYSNISVIEKYIDYDNYRINHNDINLKMSLFEHMMVDISSYLLFAKDCKINDYAIWTSDPYMKLFAFFFGCNLIFENIIDGARILELYNSCKSFYDI